MKKTALLQRWQHVFHWLMIQCVPWECLGAKKSWNSRKLRKHKRKNTPKTRSTTKMIFSSFFVFFCFLVIYAILGSIKKESTWNITAWVGIGKAALRGILLSANKPYNEFSDSNAILPDGKMHGPSGWRSNGVICGGDVSGCGSSRVGWWQDGDYWEAMERFE